jgi:PKD repeat protein
MFRFLSGLILLFLSCGLNASSNQILITNTNVIIAYEYWFDQNYAQKVMVSTAPSSVLVLTSSVSTSTLQPGVHSFNIRFKDVYGNWSVVQSDLFYKPFTSLNQTANQLTAYEYWFDQNYSQKVMVSTAPSSVLVLTSSISASTLQPGVHSFNIRFKDVYGNWSVVQSDLFYKPFTSLNQTANQLTAYEYWFDQNYSQKVMVSTAPSSVLVLTSSISASALQPGVHSFNIRFKDVYGNWSVVQSDLFFKSSSDQNVSNNKIVGYRYWIDTLLSKRVTINLSVPINPLVLNTPITMTNIPKGKHSFNIQFLDSMKRWSVAQTDSFQKNSLPISIFTVNNNVFCNQGVVNFTNLSVDGDTYLWNFGDNTTSTLTNVTHTYNVIGNYTVSLTIKDTITQVTSTQTMLIIISGDPVFSLGNDTTVCPNSNFQLQALPNQSLYVWNTGATTSVITTPSVGQYWCEVTNAYGCKWKDTINIQFHPLTQASFSFSSNNLAFQFTNTSSNAQSYFWNFGDGNTSSVANPTHTYLLPGSYTVMLVASGICGNDTSYQIVNALNIGFVNLENKESEIRLFPNPSKGEFNLLIRNVEGKHLTVNIYSPEGKFIHQLSEYSNDDEFNKSYDFKTLNDGIYLINVTIDNKTVYKSKLIIMK